MADRDRRRLALELLEARADPVPVPWKVLEVRYGLGRTQLTRIWRAAGGEPRRDGRARKSAAYYRAIEIPGQKN